MVNWQKNFIRSKPVDDLGIGFFVAVLEKVSTDIQSDRGEKRKKVPSDKLKKKKKL